METLESIVPENELIEVWANANFGSISKRDLVKKDLLQVACGYRIGRTANCILSELGLITKKYTL